MKSVDESLLGAVNGTETESAGVTADGLVAIRCGEQARRLGLRDPFAAWFDTDSGRRLVRMAKEVDRVYEEFNLARYLYTTSLLERMAPGYGQVLLLGAGFDCRVLGQECFRQGRARVYEVDTREKLGQKLEAFRRRGLAVPEWIRHVACDLREAGLGALLREEGLDFARPLLVLAEGIFFYLPPGSVRRLLDPKQSGLAPGSAVIFDCWSAQRVRELNSRLAARTGRGLFQEFPFPVRPDKLREALLGLGYSGLRITPLRALAEGYYGRSLEDEFPLSWWLVLARLS